MDVLVIPGPRKWNENGHKQIHYMVYGFAIARGLLNLKCQIVVAPDGEQPELTDGDIFCTPEFEFVVRKALTEAIRV